MRKGCSMKKTWRMKLLDKKRLHQGRPDNPHQEKNKARTTFISGSKYPSSVSINVLAHPRSCQIAPWNVDRMDVRKKGKK